ncbi:hypothetical protein HNP48_001502 [Acidovorax soli]|uniref:Uncharacterized protein n=1 Tax=Acidovorax soli TaxID=592050 RepID=A0A7X0U8D0_9BURK|nr:hypothetical protein [Acidovorax soli]
MSKARFWPIASLWNGLSTYNETSILQVSRHFYPGMLRDFIKLKRPAFE